MSDKTRACIRSQMQRYLRAGTYLTIKGNKRNWTACGINSHKSNRCGVLHSANTKNSMSERTRFAYAISSCHRATKHNLIFLGVIRGFNCVCVDSALRNWYYFNERHARILRQHGPPAWDLAFTSDHRLRQYVKRENMTRKNARQVLRCIFDFSYFN